MMNYIKERYNISNDLEQNLNKQLKKHKDVAIVINVDTQSLDYYSLKQLASLQAKNKESVYINNPIVVYAKEHKNKLKNYTFKQLCDQYSDYLYSVFLK